MKESILIKNSSKKNFILIIVIPMIIQLALINIARIVKNETLYYWVFISFWTLYLPYYYWLNKAIIFLISNTKKNPFKNLKKIQFSIVINALTTLNFVLFVAYIFSFTFYFENIGKPNDLILLAMASFNFVGIISSCYSAYSIYKVIISFDSDKRINFSDFTTKIIFYTFPPFVLWVTDKKVKEILVLRNKS
jgi:hypothetical protein